MRLLSTFEDGRYKNHNIVSIDNNNTIQNNRENQNKYEVYTTKTDDDVIFDETYYEDLYVKHNGIFIYHSFDSANKCITEVKKGYEDKILSFVCDHDLPCFSDILVLDEIHCTFF